MVIDTLEIVLGQRLQQFRVIEKKRMLKILNGMVYNIGRTTISSPYYPIGQTKYSNVHLQIKSTPKVWITKLQQLNEHIK